MSYCIYRVLVKQVHKYSDTILLGRVEMLRWPNWVHSDYGPKNNGIEKAMDFHWGELHCTYLRGKYVLLLLSYTNYKLTRM